MSGLNLAGTGLTLTNPQAGPGGFATVTGALTPGNVPILTATGIADSGVALLATLPATTVWGNNSSSTAVPAALTVLTLGNGLPGTPIYSFNASPTSGLYSSGTGNVDLSTGGNRLMNWTTANGTNYIQVSANNTPTLLAAGSTNLTFQIRGSGQNGVDLQNGSNQIARFLGSAGSPVNYLTVTNATTGNPALINTAGADTDVSLSLSPKGAGLVQFGNSTSIVANGAVVTTLTGVGPTGSHTTVQEWLQVKNSAGTVRYIPLF